MNASIDHPAWCSPRYCGTAEGIPPGDGEHRSEPKCFDMRRVMTDRGALSQEGTGLAYLTQSTCPWAIETFVHIEAGGQHLTLPLPAAVGILVQLNDLVTAGNA